MMLAGQDRIVDNERTRAALGRYRNSTTTLIEYPKACHTLEFDDCRDESLNDLVAWLDRRRADWDREKIGRELLAAMMANPGNLACD
jgi:alpha-beta hydrolase superfamily lysophospholipase